MVVNTYLNILALKPDHPAALAALASRYEAQGRYGDLVQVLTRQADAAKDSAERVALHRRIAALWADKLGKHGNAIASFEKIFESDPTDSRDQRAPQGPVHEGARLAAADRGLPQGAAAPGRGGAAGAADRDGARRRRSPERRARVDRALQPGAGGRGARRRRADGPGDAVRSRAALAGADRGARTPAAERGRAERRRGRAGAARTARRRCSTTGWARRRRRSRSSSGSRSWQPKNARAARALREIYAQAGDYAALEALYAEHGAFGDLCDQLTSLADRTADMAARTRLLERVALIAQEKLNQPERALKAYERILATDPRNRGAALALLPLYRNAQKWPRLLATYEVLLGPAAGGDALADKLELLAEARKILRAAPRVEGAGLPVVRARVRGGAEERGGAPGSGAAGRRGGRVGQPGDAVRRAHGRDDRRRGAAVAAAPHAAHRLDAAFPAAGRAQGRRGRSSNEVGFDEEADAALEQILTQTKSWADLAVLLHARADRAPDAAERVRLLFRIAQLEEERVADAAAASVTWKAILEAEPNNERALRALIRLSEARQDWAGVVEGLRRDLASRPADSREEREALLLRIANIQEVRLDDPEATFATYREVLQANPHAAPAVAGLERLLAGGYADRAGDRAPDAAVLRAHGRRAQAGRRQRGAAGDRRHARREGRAAGEAARRSTAGRPTIRRARTASAWRCSTSIRRTRRTATRCSGSRTRAGKTGELAERLRAVSAETEDQTAAARPAGRRRRAAGEAARARAGRREGLRPDPQGGAAARGRVPGAVAPVSRRAALGGAARAARHAPAGRAGRARTAGPARPDRRPRRGGAGRPGPRARRLREDAGARRRRSARAPGAGSPLRRARALARPREPAGDAGRLRLRRRGAGAGVPARRAARQPPRRRRRRARPAGTDRQGRRRTTRARAACSRSWSRCPSTGSASRRSSSRSTRRAAPGRAWRRSSTSSARRVEGPTRRRCWCASPICRRTSCRRAARRWRPGGRCWRPTRATRTRCGEIERLGDGAGALLRAGRRLSGAGVQDATRPTSRGAPTCCRGRPSCTRGAWATGAPRSTSGSWSSHLDPEDTETTAPAAAALETLYTETGDVGGLVKILRHAGAAGPPSAPDAQEDPVPRRRAGGEVAGRHRRARWRRCARSWRSIRRTGRRSTRSSRIFEAGSQHRQRVEMLRKRIDLAGDAAARQELWRRSRACSSATSATSTRRSPPASASSTRTRRTIRRWRRWRGSTSSRGVTASGWRSSSAGWRSSAARDADARRRCCAQIASLLEGPLGDPGERARPLARGAGGGARPTREAMAALERFLAPGDRRRRCGWRRRRRWSRSTSGQRPLRRAGGGGARLRRRADRRARAGSSS